jgi:hypothetical protein
MTPIQVPIHCRKLRANVFHRIRYKMIKSTHCSLLFTSTRASLSYPRLLGFVLFKFMFKFMFDYFLRFMFVELFLVWSSGLCSNTCSSKTSLFWERMKNKVGISLLLKQEDVLKHLVLNPLWNLDSKGRHTCGSRSNGDERNSQLPDCRERPCYIKY